MKISLAILWAAFVALALGAGAQDKSPLKLITTTPLPECTGDFDHFAVDLKGNRLFLTGEDCKTVEVFDLRTGKRLHTIKGFEQPHAIHYMSDTNKMIVTDGDGFGMVELVDDKDYSIVDKIKLPPAVDGARYNPVNKYYYVESGSDQPGAKDHLINIIDTKTFRLVGTITLPGEHSEAMAINHAGKKMYVNLSKTDEVGVVDLDTRQLVAKWPVPDAHVENSLVLDELNHRVFIAARKPATFIVFNTDTGKVVTTLPCTEFNDDMWFNTQQKLIYVTGSDVITVIKQVDADHYEHMADVPSGYRGKTSVYVPSLHRLYVAISGKGKPDAKLAMQVFEEQH